jgi:hypothetical protein
LIACLFVIFRHTQPFYDGGQILLVDLFVYGHTSNFSAIWWLSQLPVTGLQI